MSDQSLRARKNGLLELRFQFHNKTVSVYGRTPEECLKKRDKKIEEMNQIAVQTKNTESVYQTCLRLCSNALQYGNIHKEGHKSMMRTARFIGRGSIGSLPTEDLDAGKIEQFTAESAGYSEYTIKKAIHMLNKIREEVKKSGC